MGIAIATRALEFACSADEATKSDLPDPVGLAFPRAPACICLPAAPEGEEVRACSDVGPSTLLPCCYIVSGSDGRRTALVCSRTTKPRNLPDPSEARRQLPSGAGLCARSATSLALHGGDRRIGPVWVPTERIAGERKLPTRVLRNAAEQRRRRL
jgi:hypothetical protein